MKAAQSCPTFRDPHRLCSPWNSPGRIQEWVPIPFSRGSSQSRDQTQVLDIAGGILPAEPPGKPKCLYKCVPNIACDMLICEKKTKKNKKHFKLNLRFNWHA